MTICFDLRALQIGHQNRGIGMYIKSVLEHLPDDNNQYVFYAFDKSDPVTELGIKLNFDYKLVQTPTLNTALRSPRDLFGLVKLVTHSFRSLKGKRPDVFVQFDFMLGIPRWRKTKTVVIGYDLIPLIKKSEYLPNILFAWQHSRGRGKKAKIRAVVRSVYYRLKYRLHYKVFEHADQIVTISKATLESFIRVLRISSDKIHAIPLAPVFASAKPDNTITKTIKKPYVLYIGGTDSRKRIQDIVFAFNIARGRGFDASLVFAGNEFRAHHHLPSVEGRNAIMHSAYKDNIYFLGFVNDAEKLALYHSAHAFIFCTSYEGFGIPIIEAMSASCPVVSYNNSSIPEAAGNAALLVETGDYVAIANKLVVLQDQTIRRKKIEQGLKQAQKFNWNHYVTELEKVIQKINNS